MVPFAEGSLETLSGGERQPVVTVRAIAQDAPILLLDEPTSALDIGHQLDVLELVDRLRCAKVLAVRSTMHDHTLAGQYADRLVLLERGRGHRLVCRHSDRGEPEPVLRSVRSCSSGRGCVDDRARPSGRRPERLMVAIRRGAVTSTMLGRSEAGDLLLELGELAAVVKHVAVIACLLVCQRARGDPHGDGHPSGARNTRQQLEHHPSPSR